MADLLAVHNASAGQASAVAACVDRVVELRGWTIGVRDLPGRPVLLPTSAVPTIVLDGSGEPDPVDRTEVEFQVDGEVHLRRSATGRVPLYTSATDGRVVVATRLGLLAEVLALQPDPVALWSWCSGNGHPVGSRSVVRGVTRVAPGEHVVLDAAGGLGRSQQWRPWERSITVDDPAAFGTAARAFGDRLVAVLDAELPEDGTLLTASGGVDSTVLAYVAEQLGRRTAGLTLVSPRSAHAGMQARVLQRMEDELSGFRSRDAVPLSDGRRVSLTASAAASWLPTLHPALHVIGERGLEPLVVLGGEAADELVGSFTLTLGDWRRHIGVDAFRPWRWPRTRHVVRALTGVGRAGAGRIRVGAEPLRALSGGPPDAIDVAYGQWFRSREWRPAGAKLPGLATSVRADLWLDMNWEVLAARRVRRVVPFRDRALIELAFGMDPRLLFTSDRDKGLLVASFEDEVPAWVFEIDGKSSVGPPAPTESVDQPSDTVVRRIRSTLGLAERWDPRPLSTHEDARTLAALSTVPGVD